MGEKWESTHVRVRGERKEWKNGEGEEWGGRPVGSVAKRKEKKLDKLWGLPSTLPWEQGRRNKKNEKEMMKSENGKPLGSKLM